MADLRSMHAPIDRVAARVMRPGVHYEKKLPETAKHWRTIADTPKLIPWRTGNRQFAGGGVDLTGRRFGLFTVIGYLGRIGKSGGKQKKAMSLWLVRCACGDFEARSSKAVKNPANAEDRCAICRDVEFRRSGENDPQAWFLAKQDRQR